MASTAIGHKQSSIERTGGRFMKRGSRSRFGRLWQTAMAFLVVGIWLASGASALANTTSKADPSNTYASTVFHWWTTWDESLWTMTGRVNMNPGGEGVS